MSPSAFCPTFSAINSFTAQLLLAQFDKHFVVDFYPPAPALLCVLCQTPGGPIKFHRCSSSPAASDVTAAAQLWVEPGMACSNRRTGAKSVLERETGDGDGSVPPCTLFPRSFCSGSGSGPTSLLNHRSICQRRRPNVPH